MSLSFSVEANKGVYGLLLGSGISYSSGIPTGWGILNELCRRIMKLNGEEERDAIKWYQRKYDKPALYDEVIEMLAKTSSERQGLLKEFFEPTEEDIEEERKLPTEAHRAIAQLVKEGYIRVIVTTNFDRLLEQALDELSVQYQTLYHESDIGGMKPLAHSECTILKIHGDYRDTRFKNITDELKSYSASLSKLLNRIFDEYGMIISGWSAEWDTALRDTIKSVKGRRYSWYWHSLSGNLNEKAIELITFRDANILIDNKGADHLFSSLLKNVESINKIKKVNPECLQVKMETFKKHLSNGQEIELTELITNETKKIVKYFEKIDFDCNPLLTKDISEQYVEEIKEVVKPLSTFMSFLSYNVQTKKQERLLIETLERLSLPVAYEGRPILLDLQQLPLSIILYSIGISIVKNQNYKLLNNVFVAPKIRDKTKKNLHFLKYVTLCTPRGTYGYTHYEKSEGLYERFINTYLQEIFLENQIMFDIEEYNIFFDYFEFLLCIKSLHLDTSYFIGGIFGAKSEREHIKFFLEEARTKEQWPVLELTEHSEPKFRYALYNLVESLKRQPYNPDGLLDVYDEQYS